MESFSGLGAKIGTLMHYIGRTYEIGTRRGSVEIQVT